MSLLFRIVYAAHANGTHHKLALDALQHMEGPECGALAAHVPETCQSFSGRLRKRRTPASRISRTTFCTSASRTGAARRRRSRRGTGTRSVRCTAVGRCVGPMRPTRRASFALLHGPDTSLPHGPDGSREFHSPRRRMEHQPLPMMRCAPSVWRALLRSKPQCPGAHWLKEMTCDGAELLASLLREAHRTI